MNMRISATPDKHTLVNILLLSLLPHLGSHYSITASRDYFILSDGIDQVEGLESVVVALFVGTPRLYLADHLAVLGTLLHVEHHAGLLLDDLGLLDCLVRLLGGPVEHSV